MSDYKYYVYSSSFVVRVGKGATERLTRDGTWWEDYPFRWEVLTEGRELENEKKALEKAEQIYKKQKRRESRKKARAEHEAKVTRQQDDSDDSHP